VRFVFGITSLASIFEKKLLDLRFPDAYGGLGVGLAIKGSRVRLAVRARLRNDCGQVVHTLVSLSPNNIITFCVSRRKD